MQQRPGLAVGNRRGHVRCAEHGGQGQVPPGQGLADAHDVRYDAGVIGREQLAGAPKTGGDLIEDEQQTVPVRHLPQHCQAFGRVGVHAAGTLEDRFDDDRGELP